MRVSIGVNLTKLVLSSVFEQDRFLAFSPEQHPIVLQIGGNNLEHLAKATELANPYQYDEINFKLVSYLLYNLIIYCILSLD